MLLLIVTSFVLIPWSYCGILYPRESKTREVKSLDGIWNFVVLNSTGNVINKQWWKKGLEALNSTKTIKMPVPSGWDEITTNDDLQGFIGAALYERTFFVPKSWSEGHRVWLRLDSVHYSATVFLNGELVVTHKIGHLPFQVEVTKTVYFSAENQILVVCNNTLNNNTMPGEGKRFNISSTGNVAFSTNNRLGIDRPIRLYTTPNNYIDDINVTTVAITNETGSVDFSVKGVGDKNLQYNITLLDKEDNQVSISHKKNYFFTINKPKLWWPYLMHENPGYQYKLQVELVNGSILIDKYVQKFGFRMLTWDNKTLMINNKTLYLRGFGKVEDSDIRGSGLDYPLMMRDLYLMKWLGANAYRTSRSPHSEEMMDLADENGIMIINECPAAFLINFKEATLLNHLRALTELYHRDKNRPSTIMWSLAHSPDLTQDSSKKYFKNVTLTMKDLDPTRPVTMSLFGTPEVSKAARYLDIVSINRYAEWYASMDSVEEIKKVVKHRLRNWNYEFPKPIILSEYGAEALEGFHSLPAKAWSENFQLKYFSYHFKAFDRLIRQNESFFVGEFVSTFTDFRISPSFFRAEDNKGIFTKNREPKASAHLLRKRYWALASLANENITQPRDIDEYVVRYYYDLF